MPLIQNGDIVGCGISKYNFEIFFTLNGEIKFQENKDLLN